MSRRILIAAIFLLCAHVANAQSIPNATPGDSFGWNQTPAVGDAQTLAVVQAYVYKYYLDGATTGSVFTGVKCSGAAPPFACQVPIPTFSNGQHNITFTAANAGGESAQSTPFVFVYGNPPPSPNNMSIIKKVP